MFSATDWAVKRLLKFGLKRSLGKVLVGEVDTDQVEVALGRGSLQLSGLLLNAAYLNSMLAASPWEVCSGYIGRVSAVIPLTTLHTDPCSFDVDEVILRLRLRAPGEGAAAAAVDADGMQAQHLDPGERSSSGGGGDIPEELGGGGALGQGAIADGVKLIAGGIDNLLHQLRLSATRITLYIDLPAAGVDAGAPDTAGTASADPGGGGGTVVVSLASFEFASNDMLPSGGREGEPGGDRAGALQLNKSCSFEGLSADLVVGGRRQGAGREAWQAGAAEEEGAAAAARLGLLCGADGGGCAGQLSLQLASPDWLASGSVAIKAQLEPLQLQLHSSQLNVLAAAAAAAAAGAAGDGACGAAAPPAAGAAAGSFVSEDGCDGGGGGCEGEGYGASFVGQSGFFQGLLLPNVDAILSDALAWGGKASAGAGAGAGALLRGEWPAGLLPAAAAPAVTGPEAGLGLERAPGGSVAEDTEFFDCQSVLGSLQRSGFSSLLAAGPRGGGGGGGGGAGGSALLSEAALECEVAVVSPDVSLVLWYPPGAASAAAGPGGGAAARLAVEVGDLSASLRASARGVAADLALGRLEAAEYIPTAQPPCAAAGGDDVALEIAEFVSVPERLPPPQSGGPRAAPTFSGVCPLPAAGGGPGGASVYHSVYRSMYSSTLSQLTLSQLSCMSASWGGGGGDAQEQHVQVWPLLAVSGGRAGLAPPPGNTGTPALRATVDRPYRAASCPPSTPNPTSSVDVSLRPVSLWLSTHTLQRLAAFAAPLAQRGGGVGAGYGRKPSGGGSDERKAAVESAIDSILGELQAPRTGSGGSGGGGGRCSGAVTEHTMHVRVPLVCAVLAVPPGCCLAGGPAYSCIALDLYPLPLREPGGPAQQPLATVRSPADARLAASVAAPAAADRGSWQAQVALGTAKLYLLSSPPPSGPPAATAASPGAAAASPGGPHGAGGDGAVRCAVQLLPPEAPRGGGGGGAALLADLQQRPGLGGSGGEMLGVAWECVAGAAADPSARLDGSGVFLDPPLDRDVLQERAIATSPTVMHVRVPNFDASLSQSDLAVLWGTADCYLQLTARRLEALRQLQQLRCAEPAGQSTLALVAGGRLALRGVQLEGETPATLALSVGDAAVLSLGALGGVPQASALAATLRNVGLAKEPVPEPAAGREVGAAGRGGCEPAPLLRVPPASGGSAASGEGVPEIEVLLAQRPREWLPSLAASAACEPAAGAAAAGQGWASEEEREQWGESLTCLRCRGVNVVADGGAIALPWMAALGSWVAGGLAGGGGGGGEAGGGSDDPGGPAGELALRLQDCALVVPGRQAHGVLLLGDAHLRLPQPTARSAAVRLQCLAAFVGATATDPCVQLRRGGLLGCGYACVAQEGVLQLHARPPASPPAGMVLEASNEQLCVRLTPTSHALLAALLARCADGGGGAAAGGCVGDGGDPCAASRYSECSRGVNDVSDPLCDDDLCLLSVLQEDVFRGTPTAAAGNHAGASALLAGGWYEEGAWERVAPPSPSAAGSSPLMIEDFLATGRPAARGGGSAAAGPALEHEPWAPLGREAEGAGEGEDTHAGRWVDAAVQGGGWALIEDYMACPDDGLRWPDGPAWAHCALGPLPDGYPEPSTRLLLQHLRVHVALSPDEDASGSAAAPAVELELERLCCQVDVFAPGATYAYRASLAVHHAELRDCTSGAAPPRKMLAIHSLNKVSPDSAAALLHVVLEAVRPDPAQRPGCSEARLAVALSNLRCELHQGALLFLAAFFAQPEGAGSGACGGGRAAEGAVAPAGGGIVGTFIQRAEVAAFNVLLDYWPSRFDFVALRRGDLCQALNLFPLGGVHVQLPRVRLAGVDGWPQLAGGVVAAWLDEVAQKQVHRVVAGIRPIGSLYRVASAALQLASIPAEQLFYPSPPGRPPTSLSRELQRRVLGLLRALALEALGMGASVAAGAQALLQGRDSRRSAQPVDVYDGLRQAADTLTTGMATTTARLTVASQPLPARTASRQGSCSSSSGSGGNSVHGGLVTRTLRGVSAPASAMAGAVRCTLLGMRNSIKRGSGAGT